MQITVYIPKDLEARVREISEKEGKTIQQVLLSPWRGEISEGVESRLDRIEQKLDVALIAKGNRISNSVELQKAAADILTPDDLNDSEILAKAQKKLDETREKLERKKGETNAAWQIRKRVFERGAK